MKKFLGIFLSLFFTCTCQRVLADSIVFYSPNTTHYYQRFDNPKTWLDAKLYSESLGGYLTTILSPEENAFIYGNLGIDGTNHWLGGTDEAEEGIWEWVTGEAWVYSNWAPGEEEPNWVPQPDNGQYLLKTGQDYLTFWDRRSSYWDDQGVSSQDYTLSYITEWSQKPVIIPEPGTLVLLGSVFIGMLGFSVSKFS